MTTSPLGTLHAAILRSSVAHGRIIELNKNAALKIPGVHAVLDASDIGTDIPTIPLRLAPLAGFEKYLQPVIAHGKVRYVGEPVAIVLADSRALAEDALEVLDLTIQPLEAVPDWTAAERDAAVLFEQNGTNVATRYKANIGDVDAQFRAADYTRREKFRAHRHHRVADGNARHSRRMGCCGGTPKGQWRDQSQFLQSPRAGKDARLAGKRHRPT